MPHTLQTNVLSEYSPLCKTFKIIAVCWNKARIYLFMLTTRFYVYVFTYYFSFCVRLRAREVIFLCIAGTTPSVVLKTSLAWLVLFQSYF